MMVIYTLANLPANNCRLCFEYSKMFTSRFKHIKRLKLRCYTTEADNQAEAQKAPPKNMERSKRARHNFAIIRYFNSSPHLKEIKQYIPNKYFKLKRCYSVENLYLIDTKIANKIVKYMLPHIYHKPQAICETAPGLGLITSELLDTKIKVVRMYEPCPEFRQTLRDFNTVYPGRVDLFVKDIFQLHKMSFLDKTDNNNRLKQMLRGVPNRQWHQGPAITIVGVMTNIHFISYLLKMLALQSEIVTYGRVQLFAVMRPYDYIRLSAGPEKNLHTYLSWSVLFNLIFQHEVLDRFPREAFLPWETQEKITRGTRYAKRIDADQLYFVRINFKKKFPVDVVQLLPLYFFVRQFFGRGTNKVIPTAEKWIPGIGKNLILPTIHHNHYYKDLGIFTKFGELTPLEILSLFKEIINDPGYPNSSFAAMVQSELLKMETRDDRADEIIVQPDIVHDLEEKLDL